MTDLYLILIAFGIALVLAVLLYNWWQERKFRLEMASSFIEPKQDVLINDFVINTDAFEETELSHTLNSTLSLNAKLQANSASYLSDSTSPAFNHEVFDHPHDVNAGNEEIETVIQSLSLNKQSEALKEPVVKELPSQLNHPIDTQKTANLSSNLPITEPKVATKLPKKIDAKVDLTAIFYINHQILPEKLNAALNELVNFADDCESTVQIIGLLAKDSTSLPLNVSDVWDTIKIDSALSQDYAQIVCGLLLANRDGPASRTVINRYQHAVELLALELETTVQWLNNDDPAKYAQSLDAFCIDVDKIIGFHLVKTESGAFHGTKLRGLAEANGLSLETNGIFCYRESHPLTENHTKKTANMPLFSMINQNNQPFSADTLRNLTVAGVTFQMDIPRVKNFTEAFNQMVLVAQRMQVALNGELIDDHHKSLTELKINKISQQLQAINSMMQTFGVTPGSTTALRLFS